MITTAIMEYNMYVSHKIFYFTREPFWYLDRHFASEALSTNLSFKVLYYSTLFWKLANYWTKLSNYFLFLYIVSKAEEKF